MAHNGLRRALPAAALRTNEGRTHGHFQFVNGTVKNLRHPMKLVCSYMGADFQDSVWGPEALALNDVTPVGAEVKVNKFPPFQCS